MIQVKKRLHHTHRLYREIKKKDPGTSIMEPNWIGAWHYIYGYEKGSIGLISLPNYLMDGKTRWELQILTGDLHLDGDYEKFTSKKAAERRIEELLEGEIQNGS